MDSRSTSCLRNRNRFRYWLLSEAVRRTHWYRFGCRLASSVRTFGRAGEAEPLDEARLRSKMISQAEMSGLKHELRFEHGTLDSREGNQPDSLGRRRNHNANKCLGPAEHLRAPNQRHLSCTNNCQSASFNDSFCLGLESRTVRGSSAQGCGHRSAGISPWPACRGSSESLSRRCATRQRTGRFIVANAPAGAAPARTARLPACAEAAIAASLSSQQSGPNAAEPAAVRNSLARCEPENGSRAWHTTSSRSQHGTASAKDRVPTADR